MHLKAMSKIIHVLDKRLALEQPENGFKTSIDAVLLAAACKAREGETVLDLGCGVGSAGLCLAKRVEGIHLSGIDIQADQIETAKRNALSNHINAQYSACDIRDYKDQECFDHVICNPPYMSAGAHLASPHKSKALAMGHADTALEEWLDVACKALKHGGSLSLIHRADHIDHIIKGLKNRFGGVEIIPLYPKAGKEAGRVIVRALRNSKSPAIIHSGLILHNDEGGYSAEAEKILRGMGAID